MNNETRIQYVKEQLEQVVKTLEIKGKDYGVSHNVHINFETVADLLGVSKYQVLAVYLLKHVQSVTNAITKQPLKPQTGAEPIEGRLIDIINYCLIMMCMLAEDETAVTGNLIEPTEEELIDFSHSPFFERMGAKERIIINNQLTKWRNRNIQADLNAEAFQYSNLRDYPVPSHFVGMP